MRLEEEYKIFYVTSGQPRPYANSINTVRVEHWAYPYEGEKGKLCWPKVYDAENKNFKNEELNKNAMFERVKAILGMNSFRTFDEVNHDRADDYFRGWNVVTFVSPGIIEIATIIPFSD